MDGCKVRTPKLAKVSFHFQPKEPTQPYMTRLRWPSMRMFASADAAISSIRSSSVSRPSARPSPHGIRRAVTRPIRTSHLPGLGSVPKLVASDIPGSRAERQPRRQPSVSHSLLTLFGSRLRVSARSTAHGSRLPAWWTARWVHPPFTVPAPAPAGIGPGGGSQPAVKRQLLNLGQGWVVCEVRHRCDCCCLRDAHASERQGCRATE